MRTNFTIEDIGQAVTIIDSFIMTENTYDERIAVDEALKNKPDILMSKIIIENNELGLRMARNSVMPELNLVYTYSVKGFTDDIRNKNDISRMLNTMTDYNNKYTEWYAGVQFKMPFLTRTEKAKKLEKEYELKKAESDYLNKKDVIEVEIKNAVNDINYFKKAVDTYKKILDLQVRNLALAKKDYESGKIDSKYYVDYMNMARGAKIQHAVNDLQFKISSLRLELMKGSLLKTYGIDYDKYKKDSDRGGKIIKAADLSRY
jgi:outer membrane protein TolC